MGFVRKVGRAIDDAIIQPVVKTVESVIEDPRKLAMVALSVFAPGVGSAIGGAMGLSGTAAAIVGNTAVNTVLNGGDVKSAILAAAIPVVGKEVAGFAANSFVEAGMDKALAETAGNVTSRSLLSAAQGKDPVNALVMGGLSAGTDAVLKQVPGFDDLDPSLRKMATKAVTNTLAGNAALSPQDAINAALNIGMKAVDGRTDEEGNLIEGYFKPGGAGYIPPEELEATVKPDPEAESAFLRQINPYLAEQQEAERTRFKEPESSITEPTAQPEPIQFDPVSLLPELPASEPTPEPFVALPMPSVDDDFMPTIPPSGGEQEHVFDPNYDGELPPVIGGGEESVFDPTVGGTMPLPPDSTGTPGGGRSGGSTGGGTKGVGAPTTPGAKTPIAGKNPAVDAITNLANQQQDYRNSVLNMMMNDKAGVANIKSFKDLYGDSLFGDTYVPPSALGNATGFAPQPQFQSQDNDVEDFFKGGDVTDINTLLQILRG